MRHTQVVGKQYTLAVTYLVLFGEREKRTGMLEGLLVDKHGALKGQRFKVVGLLHRHGWVCWFCGRWVGGTWCGSLPNCDCLYPSSCGTVVEILGSEATINGGPWI